MGSSQRQPASESPRLWTRQFAYSLVSGFGLYLGYQGLIVLTPYYVSTLGSDDSVTGLVTGATMLAAAAMPLAMAGLLARYDARLLLVVSMLLLAIPSFLNVLTTDPVVVTVLHFVRGLGFGIAVVGCGTVISMLAPQARRGAAMGWWGLTGGATTVVGPSASLFLAEAFGFDTVFVLMGLLTLLTALPILRLKAMPPVPANGPASGILWGFRRMSLVLPFLVFAFAAFAYGAILTFAPLYLSGAPPGSPAVFFLVLGTVFAIFRLIGGTVVDRIGAGRVFPASLTIAGAALVLLASTPSIEVALAAAFIFGVGFGITATTTQVILISRVDREGYGTANALFAVAFNGGMGVGGTLFGVVAQAAGYASMFASTALCFVVAGILLLADRRRSSQRR